MIGRKDWGARTVQSPATLDGPKRTLVIHHTVSAAPSTYNTRAKRREHMRMLERFHIDTNGWADIGYNAVMFPGIKGGLGPEIYVGRGLKRLPAAQGGANTGTIALAVVGDFRRDHLGRAGRKRIIHFAKRCRREYGITNMKGHRDFGGTTCPGDNLYALIPELRRKAFG